MAGLGSEKMTFRLLVTPLMDTVTGPVVAYAGTVATICVLPQLFTVAPRPLKETELV
jgi:hypothetical protein